MPHVSRTDAQAQEGGSQRAAVVHVELPAGRRGQTTTERSATSKLEEAINLVQALDLDVAWTDAVKLTQVNPKSLIGTGRLEELAQKQQDDPVDVLVVNGKLSPSQQRNLELALKTKVIDRTGLILEIFGDRARTHAGRLQVELAAMTYQATRVVRAWSHLERQRGGLGKTGGPGERQVELDRRMIRDRIVRIKNELEEVEKTRHLHRKARIKAGLPVVALVGYTNAGKSTLFNAMVQDDEAMVKDMLFATLDPLMRRIMLPSGREIVLSDTVGFVSDLPHELVEAFQATLEEVKLADLLLHVHDAASPEMHLQSHDVRTVLKVIGAEDRPMLDVFNKSDLPDARKLTEEGIATSAVTGAGVDALLERIDAFFAENEKVYDYALSVTDGKALAWLHAHGEVLENTLEEMTSHVKVRLTPEDAAIFEKMLLPNL